MLLDIFKVFRKKENKQNIAETKVVVQDEQIGTLQLFNFTDFSLKDSIKPTKNENEVSLFSFDINQMKAVINQIELEHTTFVGNKPLVHKLIASLGLSSNSKLLFIEKINELDTIPKNIQNIFLLSSPSDAKKYLISIIKNLNISNQVKLFLPGNKEGWTSIDRENFAKPLVVAYTPSAGSKRLSCQINSILEWFNWKHCEYLPYGNNFRHINFLKKNNLTLNLELFDKALESRVQTLNYFECLSIHEWSFFKGIANSDEFNGIFLMRDPRDLITSFYWFTKAHQHFPLREGLETLLKGSIFNKNFYHPHFNFYWPSIEEILDIYCVMKQAKNIQLIKYEDLRTYPQKTLTNVIKNSNIFPSLFYNLKKSDWDHLALISSFKYQTNSEKKEGKHNPDTLDLSNKNLQLGCRKGIIGDWKNTFPHDLAHLFNTKYAEQLKFLGYLD